MISLTFDDGLNAHLDNAMPILDAAGLRGTFYAHLGADSLSLRGQDWADAAFRGHEIGNHTAFHPAHYEKEWVTAGNAIEFYTLGRMQLELQLANRWLTTLDGRSERSFAFPCSNPVIGQHGPVVRLMHRAGLRYTRWPGVVERAGLDLGSTRQSYAPLVRKYFRAARGGGLTFEMTAPSVEKLDQYWLPSAACHGHSARTMQAFVDRSLEAGGWAILQFHGIGGGHAMDCALNEFCTLIDWIARHHIDGTVTILEGVGRLEHKGLLAASKTDNIVDR